MEGRGEATGLKYTLRKEGRGEALCGKRNGPVREKQRVASNSKAW
jgi:hypothetical protein